MNLSEGDRLVLRRALEIVSAPDPNGSTPATSGRRETSGEDRRAADVGWTPATSGRREARETSGEGRRAADVGWTPATSGRREARETSGEGRRAADVGWTPRHHLGSGAGEWLVAKP